MLQGVTLGRGSRLLQRSNPQGPRLNKDPKPKASHWSWGAAAAPADGAASRMYPAISRSHRRPKPPEFQTRSDKRRPLHSTCSTMPICIQPSRPASHKTDQKESDGPRGAATVSADGAASRMFTAISRCCRHPQTHKQTPAAPPCPSARPATSAAAPPRPTKRPQAEGRASRRPHLTCSTMPISRSCRLCRCPRAPQTDPK